MQTPELPTVRYIPVTEALPTFLGHYSIMLPTAIEDEEDENSTQFFTVSATYYPAVKQFWMVDDTILPYQNGPLEPFVVTTHNVTNDVVAWAPIPNPSNYERVSPANA